jgi:hypothetical protein
MEYSILSAILGNPSPQESGSPPPSSEYPHSLTNTAWPAEYTSSGYDTGYGDQQIAMQPSDTTLSPTFITAYPSPQFQPPRDQMPYQSQYHSSRSSQSNLQFGAQSLNNALTPTSANPLVAKDPVISSSLVTPPASNASPSSTSSVPLAAIAEPVVATTRSNSQLQTINDLVTSPYDYTEGYHFLMKHLPTRYVISNVVQMSVVAPGLEL